MLLIARSRDKGRENEFGKIADVEVLTDEELEKAIQFMRERFGWFDYVIEVRP